MFNETVGLYSDTSQKAINEYYRIDWWKMNLKNDKNMCNYDSWPPQAIKLTEKCKKFDFFCLQPDEDTD